MKSVERLFFRVYPELAEPVRDYLESRFVGNCTLPREIGQTLSVLLTEGKVTDVGEKSQTLSNLSAGGQILLISGDDVRINPYALFNRNKMTEGDNPPIGILMCTGIGKETAEYLAPFIDQQLFLSEYQLQLPAKEKFAEFLRKGNEVRCYRTTISSSQRVEARFESFARFIFHGRSPIPSEAAKTLPFP